MSAHRYLIALGSNRPHHLHGPPQRVLVAALAQLEAEGLELVARSPVIASAPLGPSLRRYANGAAVVAGALAPPAMLALLKKVERAFGRRRGGRRWRARVLDLDIVLWSGGVFAVPGLIIPHPQFRNRDFVLQPAATIAPCWRDPVSGLTLRHLAARLTRSKALPR